MANFSEPRPGFQGSESSWVEVTFYQHGDDPVVVSGSAREHPMTGRYNWDEQHCVIGVNTNKPLDGGAGQWSVQLKESPLAQKIFQTLVDDDWVDIVFYRHDQPWHVMRGLVDEIRRSSSVSGGGASTTIYTISGRDFQKIWEITPVWFNPHATNDITTRVVASKVFQSIESILGDPPAAVEAFLRNFLEEISAEKGPNWDPPPGVPQMEEGSFLNSVTFDKDYFQDVPPRRQFNPGHIMPQGTLWELARHHSDPMFTEVYTDLLLDGQSMNPSIGDGSPLPVQDSFMTVVIRDKPFPTTADPEGYLGWWDKVPIITVPRQQIVSSDLGRSGYERFNTFFLGSMLLQEGLGEYALTAMAPLVNPDEIKRHGMRRMDVQSSMSPKLEEGKTFGDLADVQRRIIRDWYALNPYYISGTINLGMGRPDVKIGCRLRVPGAASEDEDESYYIEQVSHQFQFPKGTRTSIGVTRGWIGTDATHKDYLNKVVAAYITPGLIRD